MRDDPEVRSGETPARAAEDDVLRPPATATTTRGKLVESPWLWACVFLCGALVALQLTGPKFSWRQPQIERQFQARQRSGSTTPRGRTTPEYSQTGRPMLTLRPLALLMGAGLSVAWGLFYWHHLRRRVP